MCSAPWSNLNPEAVKIVVVGQDPYPTPGNAHGLSFSVDRTAKIPASLKTIFSELERSIEDWVKPTSGDLQAWAAQGVLLLNSILTVRTREPLSHAGIGWEKFTRAVLQHAQERSPFIVFILWGAKAAAIADPIVDPAKHFVIRGSHPSRMAQNRMPPDRKFVGNGHFVEANRLWFPRGVRLSIGGCDRLSGRQKRPKGLRASVKLASGCHVVFPRNVAFTKRACCGNAAFSSTVLAQIPVTNRPINDSPDEFPFRHSARPQWRNASGNF